MPGPTQVWGGEAEAEGLAATVPFVESDAEGEEGEESEEEGGESEEEGEESEKGSKNDECAEKDEGSEGEKGSKTVEPPSPSSAKYTVSHCQKCEFQ